jgi:prepilin-type N-terminal cleavage/methylation domain-containing protein/prepilin-type processing-associated H-X9-DG protein
MLKRTTSDVRGHRHRTFSGGGRHAFTLLELLVVVAVIALLAAMLLPALSRAKQSAWQVYCGNNLRQLAMATQLYWHENDNEAFRWREGQIDGGDLYWFGWLERGPEGMREFDVTRSVLWPYLQSGGIELCPSFNYGYSRYKLKATGASYGYGYNIHLSSPADQPPVKVSSIRRPSTIALFADCAQINTFQPPATPANPLLEEFYYINRYEPTAHFRHLKQVNIAFMDGHVDAQRMEADALDDRLPKARVGRLTHKILVPDAR